MHILLRVAAVASVVGIAAAQSAPPDRAAAAPSFRTASRRPVSLTVPSAPPASFLVGSDDCQSAHEDLGGGPIAGMPFTTGTTGSEGQNEAGCSGGAGPGMHRDVWYDWTADRDGRADWRTCASTSLDTRLQVWPFIGSVSCPLDGSSIACDDDRCFGPSSVTWPVTAGTKYTLQLAVVPGEAAGGGTFDISIFEGAECGQYDDGSTETSFGHHIGELGWLHTYDCFASVDAVRTVYGSLTFPGSVANGRAGRIAVYEDLDDDGDPRTGLVLLAEVSTIVTNANTDILNEVALPGAPIAVQGGICVLASSDHVVFEFPAPLDLNDPTDAAWITFNEGFGSLDLEDLNQNDTPPIPMAQIGFPTAFLLRAVGTEGSTDLSFCHGDGSGTPCPCGNDGAPGTGCAHSGGVGCELGGSGSTSASVDAFVLWCRDSVPQRFGLFFQGDDAIGGGDGVAFGDGLRCAGGSVVRLEVVLADADGAASSSVPIAATGEVAAGDTKRYQWWYRDPTGSPCGSGFNLSNGLQLTWQP